MQPVRNADLATLQKVLVEQGARQLDLTVPSAKISFSNGNLVLRDTEAELTDDGVLLTEGTYQPTEIFDDGLAKKLTIPREYMRRMREQRPDIFDTTCNGWLRGDSRKFFVRLWRGETGEQGVARALMSSRYGVIDNLDVLMAVLDGVRAAGIKVAIPPGGADLTERNMYVRITAPEISAYADDLLHNYRSPFDHPSTRWLTPERISQANGRGLVFAGFAVRNSEVGSGACTLTPVLIFEVCGNGMTVKAEAVRAVHLGPDMDEGVIKWTADTEAKALALIKARARDAVTTWLDVDWVKRQIDTLSEQAGVTVADPAATIEVVAKQCNYTTTEQATILDHFIKGGQVTAGGIMQAVTSTAQTLIDPDDAARLEGSAIQAMGVAAARGVK